MKGRPAIHTTHGGYCLAEAMLVVSLICICFGIGYATFPSCLHRQQARALAQSTQAATAWTQVGVLWRGSAGYVAYDGTELRVESSSSGWGGDLSGLVSRVIVYANIARWNTTQGFEIRFVDPFAAPDSGGSLYFQSGGGAYRLTIRPESGVTTRKWVPR